MNVPTFRMSGLARACAVRVLSPLLLTAVLRAQVAPAAPAASPGGGEDQDLVVLDKFEVVGSRIKRLDGETVSPVVRIEPSTLQATGFTSIGDALRSLPFNGGQALTSADAGGSFTPGISTMNLRGLGNNQTLVLINGRRSAPYAAPGYDGFQTMFDLNSIPEAAIDSVEILKDGASALYGSDAVAGVVNFKFRRDFQGAVAKAEVGNYFDTGGLLKKASLIAGTVQGKTSVVATVDWEQRDPVFARDLSYSRSADKSAKADTTKPSYRGSGWENITVPGQSFASEADYVAYALENHPFGPFSGSPIDDYIFDNTSGRGFPGYVKFRTPVLDENDVPEVDPDTGEPVTDTYPYTYGSATADPRGEAPEVGVNYYDYQTATSLFPKVERYSFFSTIRHEFSANLYGFADLSFSRVKSEVHSAPTPVDLESEQGLSTGSQMYLPWENPYNPFALDAYNTDPNGLSTGRRRMIELGDRINAVTSDTPRAVLGLGGKFAATDTWSWETAGLYAKNRVRNIARNSVTDFGMQQALLGLTRAGDGGLTYNPATPASQRVYFNWFGENDPAFARFLAIENPNTASLEYWSYDASASGALYDLPGGPLGLALGTEYRREKFASERTALNATANIVGGEEGTSSYGKRNVTSLFGELSLPVFKAVEFQVAGRFEDYSDKDFASSLRPKVGVKIRPTDWLLLRASYSKSFKAPDLAYLYTSTQTSFTSNTIWDAQTGREIDGLKIVTMGNPTLRPELTDSWYAGVVVAPKGALKGLEFDLDFFRYEQKNVLGQYSQYYGYTKFLSMAAAGDPRFTSKVIRSALTGEVIEIHDDYTNISSGLTQGADIGVRYHWDTRAAGDLVFGVNATYNDQSAIDGENFVGTRLNARWNATASVGWLFRDWEWNAYGVYRGRRTGTVDLGTTFAAEYDQDDNLYVEYSIKPQFTLNTSVTYKGFKKLKVTVGVNNVFNSEPPFDPQEPVGFTPGVSDPEPAFWFVSLEREF